MATTRHHPRHRDHSHRRQPVRRWTGWLRAAAAGALAVTALGAPSVHADEAPRGLVIGADSTTAVDGSFVVTLKESAARARAGQGAALMARYGGEVKRTYTHALNGYSASLSDDAAARLAADPQVDKVYQDQRHTVSLVQPNPPSWGLDRIDQAQLPMDDRYSYPDNAGGGVTVYVVDTGLRVTHQDFGGRAQHGYDAIDDDHDVTDGNGHGTHVATTATGEQYGVAKRATVVGVRVLDDQGRGTTEQVVAGIDWVTRSATENALNASVANLSLGGAVDEALDQAVRNSVLSGVTFVVAAGNANEDAATTSPARVEEAITVGATDRNDARAEYSNYGASLDLFAPGTGITAGWHTADDATQTISGTSMASPHVAGAAALHLAEHPAATPPEVALALRDGATEGVVGSPGPGSPNKLLHMVT